MINEALHLSTDNRKKCKEMQNILQDFKKKNTDLQVFYKEVVDKNIEIKEQKEHLKDPRTV